MAQFGRVLIKLGNSDKERFASWQGDEPLPISYRTFSGVMTSPGYPSYTSQKSIREKWLFMQDLNLASNPRRSDGVEVVMLDPVKIRQYIMDTIPPKIASDPVKRHEYLKGMC